MDKKKELVKLKKDYITKLKRLNQAAIIAEKLDPLLPPGWISDFSGYTLDILCWEKEHRKEEYKLVCGLVEKIIGIKLSRTLSADQQTKDVSTISATVYIPVEDAPGVYLWISVILNKPKGCQLEIDKIITEEKIIFKIDDACLGIA